MDGDTPDPLAAAADSVHATVTALEAMKGYRACRGDVGGLRKLGACGAIEKSAGGSAETAERLSQRARVVSSVSLLTP
jgi:hypothetical protein